MIKRALLLIVALCAPCFSDASLSFTSLSDNKVKFGNTGTDPTVASFYAWIYPTAWNSGQRIMDKSASPARNGYWRFQARAVADLSIRCLVDLATADADAVSAANTITLNSWQFVACTYDGSNPPKIYVALPNANLAEVTYQGTPNAGSGARVSDGGADFTVGAEFTTGSNIAFGGQIGVVNWMPGKAMSLAELQDHMRNPRAIASSKVFSYLGFNGTGTQYDLSGNGFNGTVSGAVGSANGPPISIGGSPQ